MNDVYEPISRQILIQQGVCCGNGCSNCPYNPKHIEGSVKLMTRTKRFTGNRHDVGYAKTKHNVQMIDFIQTVAGQRILASMDRFTKELPEKLDKISTQMERIADGLERMQAVNEGRILPSEHGEPDALPSIEIADLQQMVDAGVTIENAIKVAKDDDFTEEKAVEMPEQEEGHIPVVFGAEAEDDSGVPLETGAMNKQHVPTEKKEAEEKE